MVGGRISIMLLAERGYIEIVVNIMGFDIQ